MHSEKDIRKTEDNKMASTTPRYLNSTVSSAHQQYSPSASAPPMKKQRATGTPNAAAGGRNNTHITSWTTEDGAAHPEVTATSTNTGPATANSGFSTASDAQQTVSTSRTNTAGVIRPPTSHTLTMSSQVREAVKSRREELRKLQEQNKYTRSIVFPPASRKQQIISLAKAQLASGTVPTLLVANGKSNGTDRISTSVSIPKHNGKSFLTTNKENATRHTAAKKEVRGEEIETPSRPQRLDLVYESDTTTKTQTKITTEISNTNNTETPKNGVSGDAIDSRAQVFQTMMKNADFLKDGEDESNVAHASETTTLRLLTELKKSKMKNEEELMELKETVEQMTTNSKQAPNTAAGMLLFDDDATVTSVRTASRGKVGSGLGLSSLMSPIRPSISSLKQKKKTTKGGSQPRTNTKQQQFKNESVPTETAEVHISAAKKDNGVDDLKQYVEQAIQVAVQRFTSAAGNEYVVAFVSPLAENVDTLEYYNTNIIDYDPQNFNTRNTLLSKLATDELNEVVSSLISLFHNSNDTTALAVLARYIRVYAFIQADQSVFLVKHSNKEPRSTQVIHWNGETGNVLGEYNLTMKDTQSHQTLKSALGNFPFIDSFGREREYQLSEIYREAMVVQRDFLTSIASTTWAFLQTSSSTTSSAQKNVETIGSTNTAASILDHETGKADRSEAANLVQQIGENSAASARTAEVSTMLFDETHDNSSSVTFGSLVSPVKPVSHHPLFTTHKADASTAAKEEIQSSYGDINQNLAVVGTGTHFAACNATPNDSVAADLPQYVEQAFCVAAQKFTSTQGNEYEIAFLTPSEEDSCKVHEDVQQQPLSRLSNVEKNEVISSVVYNMTSSSVPADAPATESALTKLARYIRVHAFIKADQSRLLLKHQPALTISDSDVPTTQVQIFHFQSTSGRIHYNLEAKDLSSEKSLSERLGRIIYIDAFGREQEYNLADVCREAILVQQHFLMGVTSSAWAFYRKDILSIGQPRNNNISITEEPSYESATSDRRIQEELLQEPLVQQHPQHLPPLEDKEEQERQQEYKTLQAKVFQPTRAPPSHTESAHPVPSEDGETLVIEESKTMVDQATNFEKSSVDAIPKVAGGFDKRKAKLDDAEPVDTTVAFIMLLGFLSSITFRFLFFILLRIPVKAIKLAVRLFFWTCILKFAWLLLVDDSGLRLNQYSGAAGRVVNSAWPTIPILQKTLHDLFGIGYGGDIDHYHNEVY